MPEDAAGLRLDKALVAAIAGLREADLPEPVSRSRLTQLIAEGALAEESGATVRDPKRKVKAAERFLLSLPEIRDAEPQPEAIPLTIIHEDEALIVIDKPAGMVVHPAPGSETGTLVNALLHHCGDSLAGIGGERRPGIVHRIDKDTSGLLVVAKTQGAHAGLAALFAEHDIERSYLALANGAPDRADPRLAGLAEIGFEPGWIRIESLLDRHPHDRKRMAVTKRNGRNAVTRLKTVERFGGTGAKEKPFASLLECRLETGRTHQIRVHAAHIGHSLIGDPVYGKTRAISKSAASPELQAAISGFGRQALHAASLGFRHPVSGEMLSFRAEPPPDFCDLLAKLRRESASSA